MPLPPATPKQTAAFEDLSRGGGFFNHIGGFFNPPGSPGKVTPLLSSVLFVLFDNLISSIAASSPFLTNPTPVRPPGGPPVSADVTGYPAVLAGQLQNYIPEYYGTYFSIKARQEFPKEDPLFALTAIPGVSSASTAGSLMEHTDKYFGHERTSPYFYYKTGLPPLLIKFASAKSVNDLMNSLGETSYPSSQPFTIIAVTTGLNGTWTVAGDFHLLFASGSTFFITGNPGGGSYTVFSSLFNGTNTVITVGGTIPGSATAAGTIGAVFPAGYFSNTFPKVNAAPFVNASVPLLTGNSWYFDMIGTIAGAIETQIDDIVTYYTVTLPNDPAGQAFLTTLNSELALIYTALFGITSYATFVTITGYPTYATPSFLTNLNNIAAAYATVTAALPPPAAQRARIDAQIIQENLRYYGHMFPMLNQGSVSTGFYQYKKDPNAYPILQQCTDETVLAAINENPPGS